MRNILFLFANVFDLRRLSEEYLFFAVFLSFSSVWCLVLMIESSADIWALFRNLRPWGNIVLKIQKCVRVPDIAYYSISWETVGLFVDDIRVLHRRYTETLIYIRLDYLTTAYVSFFFLILNIFRKYKLLLVQIQKLFVFSKTNIKVTKLCKLPDW